MLKSIPEVTETVPDSGDKVPQERSKRPHSDLDDWSPHYQLALVELKGVDT